MKKDTTKVSVYGCWWDGTCKACGSDVVEQPSNREFDYMNRCSNSECVNHEWHHCYDCDELDYYIHKIPNFWYAAIGK